MSYVESGTKLHIVPNEDDMEQIFTELLEIISPELEDVGIDYKKQELLSMTVSTDSIKLDIESWTDN